MTASPHDRIQALAPVDAAWLRMDHPTNLMMVAALLSFDRLLEPHALARLLEERLLPFERFRQRVVLRGFPRRRPCWQLDPRLDISSHLRRIALPTPGDEDCLQEVVGDLLSTPLDPSKPLWQMHLIENYRGSCALLVRIHHCIADGIALMHVLLSLTDDVAEPGNGGAEPAAPEGGLRAAARFLWEDLLPLARPSKALGLALTGAGSALTAGHLLLRPPDPPTVLKGPLGVAKRAAWSEGLALAEIKAIGAAAGCTVNDVLLGAAAGALRRYLQSRGEPTEGLDLHAVVPVNLRSPEEGSTLGNRFGLVFVTLPVGLADPLERLFAVRREMAEIKQSPEAAVALRILGTLGLTPARLQRAFVELVGAKASAVVTNVPGPAETVFLCGAPLRSALFWVPTSGRLGLGISLLSYRGRVRLGVAADRGLIPGPEAIAAGFERELAALARLAHRPEPVSG